jgi:hypothetical protein
MNLSEDAIMEHKESYFLLSILFAFLVSCGNQPAALSTEIPVSTASSPTPFPTLTFVPITPSPLPTEPIIFAITPDPIQVERWKEYERALAMILLPPNPLRGEVLCEWEILGQFTQEVYVWAFCQSPPYSENLPASIASVPAVIYLKEDRSVQDVQKPGSGTAYANDVRKLFPPNVQEIIFSHAIDTSQMEAHINLRRENPGPPLIILSAMPTQTPAP